MQRREALAVLSEHGWLARSPVAFRDAVLQCASLQRYGTGELIFAIGDPAGGIYGVASGSLELALPTPDGDISVAHVATVGAWLGGAAMLTRSDRPFGLRALGRCNLLHVPLAAIQEIGGTDARAWREFGRMAAEEAEWAYAATAALLLRDGRQRALSTLIRLTVPADARPALPEICVSQATLAALANQSRAAIGSLLAELQARGVVNSGYRRLSLRDAAGLRRQLTQPETTGATRGRALPRLRRGRGGNSS